jgi:hypothetical protein
MFWRVEFYCSCYKYKMYFIVSSWKPLYIKESVQWLLLPTQQFFSYITATKLIFNEIMMCTLKKIYFSKCNISEQIEWQNISASVTEMNTQTDKVIIYFSKCNMNRTHLGGNGSWSMLLVFSELRWKTIAAFCGIVDHHYLFITFY